MRPAVLIYNPKSGRQVAKRLLPRVLEILRRGGFDVEPLATAGPADATRLAAEAVAASRAEVAFAMGGDGTLREVACGLLGSDVALAPLPTGTTNVMVLALGLPQNTLAAARALATCEPRRIDVGSAGGEPFLMQVSAGLDATIMALQSSRAKKRFGKGAVAWTGVRQWLAYDYPLIEVTTGDRRHDVGLCAACNIPYYAGPYRMAPEADLRDGLLDLVLFTGRGRLDTLGFAADLARGRHTRRADVEVLRVESLRILGPPATRVQLDGDVLPGTLPLQVEIGPQRLWVLAPVNKPRGRAQAMGGPATEI